MEQHASIGHRFLVATTCLATVSMAVALLVSLPASSVAATVRKMEQQQQQQHDVLDNELVDLSIRCMELAYQVQLHEDNTVANSYFYEDGPHAAMFVQQDHYCFLVFDSTHSHDENAMADWYVNFDPTNAYICAPDGTCCETRNGYKRAYADTAYRSVLDQQVRDCRNGGNEVVIVGHSQGGGIAPVGAVALADTEPTVILFGAPGSVSGNCPPLLFNNGANYHRWLNTFVDDDGTLAHDHVANLNWRSEQYGNMYLMGDDPQNIVYFRHGEYPTYTSFAHQAHQRHRYQEKFAAYAATRSAGKSIGSDGWADGYACNRDNECIHSCIDSKCQEASDVGGWCNDDGDCSTGRCEGNIPYMWPGTCEERLEGGESCDEDSDCISESCPFALIGRSCT